MSKKLKRIENILRKNWWKARPIYEGRRYIVRLVRKWRQRLAIYEEFLIIDKKTGAKYKGTVWSRPNIYYRHYDIERIR